MKKWLWRIALLCLLLIIIGFALPERLRIPVQAATEKDWNHSSFWHAPWGNSGVHKGIDIFAAMGTPVVSASYGIVVYRGKLGIGGKVVLVLGPKWKLHYYAHLDEYDIAWGRLVGAGQALGRVGTSGNAKGKPPHLHYSIISIFPRVWRWDRSAQAWKKMFFLDPTAQLLDAV